jgi:hypothetical protein
MVALCLPISALEASILLQSLKIGETGKNLKPNQIECVIFSIHPDKE